MIVRRAAAVIAASVLAVTLAQAPASAAAGPGPEPQSQRTDPAGESTAAGSAIPLQDEPTAGAISAVGTTSGFVRFARRGAQLPLPADRRPGDLLIIGVVRQPVTSIVAGPGVEFDEFSTGPLNAPGSSLGVGGTLTL